MLKKTLFVALAVCSMLAAVAQSIETPQPSPTQTVKQNFGLSSITLVYSRPGIKGRKIFGDLVPFGKVWRTGANSATTIEFGDDVTIGGTKIPKGEYGLITIPDKDVWTVIISKQLDITSPAAYKPENDLVRTTVKPVALKDAVESFTIQFANVKPTSCDIQLMWENTMVTVPVTTDVDSKVTARIKEVMNSDNRPYFQAALYYLENGKDLNQALVWFDKAAEQQPDAYWVHLQRANCLAKLGKKEEAKAASQKSRELAMKAGNEDYVRLNDKLMAQLK
ncbi:MAG: DUF2911 domain-containing protein [Bacteroidetes bacterium]|nr:DUF2911 domain-containing protein [Bacteroidota bacterium]